MTRFFVLCCLLWATPSYADDWSWSATPYLWLTDVSFDTGVPGSSGGSAEFSDLLENLDFAAQLHVEGYKNRVGFMLDVTNMQLSDRTTHGPTEVDTDVGLWLLEGAAIIALSEDAHRIELLLGLRSLMVDLEVEIETTAFAQRVSEKETLVDVMIGLRYIKPLSDKWTLALRGDVATGDTDFSWNASALLGRRIGESATLLFGYRHLAIEFDSIGALEPEIALSGPEIGLTYRF